MTADHAAGMTPGHAAGRLAEVGPADRLRALRSVREGKVFTLGMDLFGRTPAPRYPDSPVPLHIVYQDWSHYEKGTLHPAMPRSRPTRPTSFPSSEALSGPHEPLTRSDR